MSRRRNIVITASILFVIAFGVMALAMVQQWRYSQGELGAEAPDLSEQNTYLYDEPRTIGEFSLLDEQGDAADNQLLEGQWTIAFVGFTTCPDICPATMATLSRAKDRVSEDVPEPQFLMISADPERDTPERLNNYVTFFGDGFRGLTGDYDTLESLARDLNAVFMHSTDETGEVVVDHSTHLALISPQGQFAGIIQPPHDAQTIADIYEAVVSWQPPRS